MKKLNKLKLHDFSKTELMKSQQNVIRGGASCYCHCTVECNCPCSYEGTQEGPDDSYYGGSTTADNNSTNASDKVGDAHQSTGDSNLITNPF